MANPLQSAANAAFKQLPYGMQRVGEPEVLPADGRGSSAMRAGVENGNPVSAMFVGDEGDFKNPDYAPQLLRHEQTHRIQANWPGKLQKELPPINPKDPYNFGGAKGIEKIGSDPMKLSQEQMAAAEQTLQADKQNGKVPESLKKLDENFQAIPLSVMEPTDPNGKGINTMARAPGLPMNGVWGTKKLLEADNTIPVKPGSGTEAGPWQDYAQQTAQGPWQDYAPQAAPAERPGTAHPADLPEGGEIDPKTGNRVLQATSKRNELGSIFPAAGMTAGSLIGSIGGPVGMSVGGGIGGAAGERAKEWYEGQPSNPEAMTKAGLIGGLAGPLDEVAGMIPTRGHASQIFSDIEDAAKNVPVSMSETNPALGRFSDYVSTGGSKNQVLTKLGNRIGTDEPVNFPEARDFYTNVSRITRRPGFIRRAMESPMKPSMRMAAGDVRSGLNNDLTAAASSIGRGEDYTNAMKEYGQAAKLNKYLKLAGAGAAAEGARRTGLLGKVVHTGMSAAH